MLGVWFFSEFAGRDGELGSSFICMAMYVGRGDLGEGRGGGGGGRKEEKKEEKESKRRFLGIKGEDGIRRQGMWPGRKGAKTPGLGLAFGLIWRIRGAVPPASSPHPRTCSSLHLNQPVRPAGHHLHPSAAAAVVLVPY